MLTNEQLKELTEIKQNAIYKIIENYTDCTSNKELKSIIKSVEEVHDSIIEVNANEKSYRKTKLQLQIYNIKVSNILKNRYK